MALRDRIRAARAVTLATGLLLGGIGCPLAPGGSACTDDLGVRYEPREATLGVGEALTPKVQYLGCRGSKVLDTQIVYASSDPTSLEVDLVSGLARARSVGKATLVAESRQYGSPVHIPVTVTAGGAP